MNDSHLQLCPPNLVQYRNLREVFIHNALTTDLLHYKYLKINMASICHTKQLHSDTDHVSSFSLTAVWMILCLFKCL